MITGTRLLLAILFVLSIQAEASMLAAKSFMKDLVDLSKLSRDAQGKVGEESTKQVQGLSAKIDFLTLAKKSFGVRWNKFSANERKDFLKTLQELLEIVVYPNAKKIAADTENLHYKETGTKVHVTGSVQREKNGEVVNQDVETVLIFDTKSDKIVDAIIEGEVFSANLKRQFDEALKKQTFASIIEKMKKRVNEARAKK